MKAVFTQAQAASLWTLLDSMVAACLLDEDNADAEKWRRLRDKFKQPLKAKCGKCQAPINKYQTWCAACGSNDEDE